MKCKRSLCQEIRSEIFDFSKGYTKKYADEKSLLYRKLSVIFFLVFLLSFAIVFFLDYYNILTSFIFIASPLLAIIFYIRYTVRMNKAYPLNIKLLNRVLLFLNDSNDDFYTYPVERIFKLLIQSYILTKDDINLKQNIKKLIKKIAIENDMHFSDDLQIAQEIEQLLDSPYFVKDKTVKQIISQLLIHLKNILRILDSMYMKLKKLKENTELLKSEIKISEKPQKQQKQELFLKYNETYQKEQNLYLVLYKIQKELFELIENIAANENNNNKIIELKKQANAILMALKEFIPNLQELANNLSDTELYNKYQTLKEHYLAN